jgi:hypothetical protein
MKPGWKAFSFYINLRQKAEASGKLGDAWGKGRSQGAKML